MKDIDNAITKLSNNSAELKGMGKTIVLLTDAIDDNAIASDDLSFILHGMYLCLKRITSDIEKSVDDIELKMMEV